MTAASENTLQAKLRRMRYLRTSVNQGIEGAGASLPGRTHPRGGLQTQAVAVLLLEAPSSRTLSVSPFLWLALRRSVVGKDVN